MARIRNDIEYSKTNKTNLSCCPLNKNLGVGEWNLAFLFVFMFACNLIFFSCPKIQPVFLLITGKKNAMWKLSFYNLIIANFLIC